jgi:hypothetical protein
MLIATAKRTDLLQLGVRLWDTQHADVVPVLDPEGCILVWREEPDVMPDAVIVADGTLQSFFAWTTTYAPHLTPISALVEVAEHGDFVASLRDPPSLGDHKKHIDRIRHASQIRGYLGLIHAEVAASFEGGSAPLFTGLTPYVSTFSWVAFQQQVMNELDVSLRTLREHWDEASRLLNAFDPGYRSENVEEVWGLIVEHEHRQDREAKQIGGFLESVRAGSPNSRELFSLAGAHAVDLKGFQTGPLEARVDLFRKLTQSLYDRRNPPPGNAALLGFALSLISQGSFAHVGLLGPSRVADVRPLLWYGWFDFQRHEPTAASPATSAATWQLLSAVREEASSWLRQDISLSELRVLCRHKDPFSECLLDIRHPVQVALSRKVICTIQPGRLTNAVRGRHRQRSLFEDPL